MADVGDDGRKKLQITERLQKREEERLHNIQQRRIVKEDETVVHVCEFECYLLQNYRYSVLWGVSVCSADVNSRCMSPHLGCRWLAAVLLDTCAAAALIVCIFG